MLQNIIDINKI